jgi:Raf kinase inhibitor-like YbhB/YbcL family protein
LSPNSVVQTIIDGTSDNYYAETRDKMTLALLKKRISKTMFCIFMLAAVAGISCHINEPAPSSSFILRSPDVEEGGQLPKEFTGDGASATLPLEWNGAPTGTRSYAVIMHHIDPEGKVKWYWILYNIPANVQSLPRNVKGIGILGNNSVNGRTEYAPPHSKGPGPKTYIYTVYALSASPQITVPPGEVSRDILLSAMKDYILDTAELKVIYTRYGGDVGPGDHKIK